LVQRYIFEFNIAFADFTFRFNKFKLYLTKSIEIDAIIRFKFLDNKERNTCFTIFMLLCNQSISTLSCGTEDVSVATIYRTCFVPSELKLWNL
ncbi:hypothetical protein BpHYR1_020488, partial [Brachionus plicatilis]